MNKIISFSLWGDSPKYCIGSIKNAQLAQIIYPEFRCLFFINNCVPKETIDKLQQFQNVEIKFRDYPGCWLDMFNRFQPHFWSDSDVVLVRDCDSRLNWRERACYDLWLQSNKGIMALNDHPFHSLILMGGLHSSRKGAMIDMCDSFEKFLANCGDHSDRYQIDQDWLNSEVLPYKLNDILWFNDFAVNRGALPFPTPRQDLQFCGEIIDEAERPNQEHRKILADALGIKYD